MSVAAKICGLTTPEALKASIEGGAAFVGFVFVGSSRRAITAEQARDLLCGLPQPALCRFQMFEPDFYQSNGLVLTALFVDPEDQDIAQVMEAIGPFLGLIQLHGQETPERVAQIKTLTQKPVMKAMAIAREEDFGAQAAYEAVCDALLFDTKTESGATGGTGKSFDWSLLKNRIIDKPWMLAGGLKADNVARAVSLSGARIVDCSSGVEKNGQKDAGLISDFLQACRTIA